MTPALDTLRSLGGDPADRAAKAQRAVDLIRTLGPYRWAGLYDVLPTEIAVVAVIGTIDVESDHVDAFTDRDAKLLARCAETLSWLWRAANHRE